MTGFLHVQRFELPAPLPRPSLWIVLLLVLASVCTGCTSRDADVMTPPDPTFTNPVLGQGQDPSIVVADGYYNFVQSGPDRSLTVRRSRSLLTLKDAPRTTVWTGGRDGTPCCELWAPDLAHIGSKWYVYFAADDGDNDHHRLYVIEADEPEGPYRFKGKLTTPDDKWAIDGTVLQMPDASLYFVWSGWPGDVNGEQALYIARMTNPWTVVPPRVAISEPQYEWEKAGAPPAVNEGPAVLLHQDRVYVTYSASGCWTPDYKLGLLSADAGADLLDPDSWHKSAEPVFQRNDTAGVYGPGHNGFFKSPDGTEDWMAYHAVTDPAGNCGGERTVRVQPVTWNADGRPDFGIPLDPDAKLSLPSGDGSE